MERENPVEEGTLLEKKTLLVLLWHCDNFVSEILAIIVAPGGERLHSLLFKGAPANLHCKHHERMKLFFYSEGGS